MGQSQPEVVIDMVADPVCPWCYIGFRGLDWAVMALSFERPVRVRYRPYRLDPTTPPEGRDRAEALAQKFPDAKERGVISDALTAAMKDVGVSFDPRLPERLPDTTDAHRLLRWAGIEGRQKEVLAGLFEAYWHHGDDLGDHDVLGAVAGKAEMSADDVRLRLATDEDRRDVQEEAAAFRAGGVTGVPAFIVNEQTGFEGALPKADLHRALAQLIQDTSAAE